MGVRYPSGRRVNRDRLAGLSLGSIQVVTEVAFTPRSPYDLRLSIGPPDASRRFRNGVLELVYPLAEGEAFARVWQRHDGQLHARIDAGDAAAAHDRLADLLTLRLDHRPFLELAAADPLLQPLRARLRGLRPLRMASPAQALIRAVSGQLIRSSEALRIERRIMRSHGRPSNGLMLPPSAGDLASTHPALFERAGLSPARGVVLQRAARRLRLAPLATDAADIVERRIRREPGLGPWSVGVVMVYGLGRHERGLAGDLALVRLGDRLGVSQEELLGRYGEWQGMASVWLMHHPLSARMPAARTG
jgi:3-methyladenine DNA glycosylase/8-oxoguanine DNA glycosylase